MDIKISFDCADEYQQQITGILTKAQFNQD